MNKNSYCVIMAGGLGKRFWPVSTKACPKQFCDILNVGKSFLRQTFERANQIFDTRNIFIVTGSAYEELTKQQIPEIPSENILKEPFGKNTAPCVAYAAYRIARINPHASMVVVPSDHFITNDVVYLDNIQKGISLNNLAGYSPSESNRLARKPDMDISKSRKTSSPNSYPRLKPLPKNRTKSWQKSFWNRAISFGTQGYLSGMSMILLKSSKHTSKTYIYYSSRNIKTLRTRIPPKTSPTSTDNVVTFP